MITMEIIANTGTITVPVSTVMQAKTLARLAVASPDCEGVTIYEGNHRTHQLYRDTHENVGVQWEYVKTCDGRTLAMQTTFDVANATSEALTI